MMSIFDNTFLEAGWDCISATKNINDCGEYKDMVVKLTYQHEEHHAEVAATYSVNVGGKISKQKSVKMFVKLYDLSQGKDDDALVIIFCRSLRAFREEEMTEEMVKDINIINAMFDKASDEVRRVYL